MAASRTLARLLAECAAGDRASLAELYRVSAPTLFAISVRILKRRDVAEEVLQDAFVSIWRNAGSYDLGQGSPMTWMVSVVRNRSIDRLRRVQREVPLEDGAGLEEPEDPRPDPFERAVQNAQARALALCLDELEAEQRRCILMAYYEGASHADLARRLAVPIETIKSRIRRELMRLRQCLER